MDSDEITAEFDQFKNLVKDSLTHAKIMRFIQGLLGDRQQVRGDQLQLELTEDLIKLIMGVLKADEAGVPYKVEYHEGYLTVNGFRIPALTIEKKGGVKHVV